MQGCARGEEEKKRKKKRLGTRMNKRSREKWAGLKRGRGKEGREGGRGGRGGLIHWLLLRSYCKVGSGIVGMIDNMVGVVS